MIDTGLAEKDWSLPSVKRLNPRAAAKRYEKETKVEGDYVSPSSLHLSADGRLLCFKSYREVDPRTEKIFDDLVVCDVAGLSLKRRWCISSRDTDVFPDITCAPDGTVFVAETKGGNDHYETALTRYAKGDRSHKTHVTFAGKVSNLVFSPDGSRVAMLINGKVHFLDEKLQTVVSHRAPKKVVLEQFLKSGDVLATASRGIMTLNAEGKWRAMPYRDAIRWISLNADETLCAISINKRGLAHEQKSKDQYGFKLLSFPKMKLLRHFQIPAHELIKATLSPDGKLVVAEASECGKRNTFIVVFDVKTGREIARRKVEYSSSTETAFLPRGNVLVMTTSGHMRSEPIILWRIPI
jgi:WD40 repeat protein